MAQGPSIGRPPYWNSLRRQSTVTWCRSATRRSPGFLPADCRIRSAACDTLPRFCARHELWSSGLPLGPALRSADPMGPLFAGFIATMAKSDFFEPFSSLACGIPPFHCGPARQQGSSKTSQVPVDCFGAYHGSRNPRSLASPHQLWLGGCCLQLDGRPRHSGYTQFPGSMARAAPAAHQRFA